ncbi:MAG: hypothetical protein OJF47_002477 [Nitrospira sp.]|jgi:hypothetical protein|nr:MAG: hypothetical protein OJF47_002477 [Nitrospira sp.]
MYRLRSFHLRDLAACGAALRRLGVETERLTRSRHTSFTLPREPAWDLVRPCKSVRSRRRALDPRSLADEQVEEALRGPSLTRLLSPACTGVVLQWSILA